MEIGGKILELRKQMNLSQEQLAEKVGVARQTISKWELSETYPDLQQAKILSRLFNVSLDDLTNNDIKNVLITKVSNTEKVVRSIMNILKIILLSVIILVIVLVSIVFFKDYFDVQPGASMQSINCTISGKDYTYQLWMNNESSYIIDKIITDDSQLSIDTKNYTNFEQAFDDIRADVVSRGGACK